MAIAGPFTNAKIIAGNFDFTGYTNNVQFNYDAEMLNKSVFGDTTTVNLAGLKNASITGSGFVDHADDGQDEVMEGNIGTANISVSLMIPITQGSQPAEADRAFFFRSIQQNYQHGGAHGPILPYSYTFVADKGDPISHGWVLEPGETARTTSSNGTGTQSPGDVTATENLYAALHVLAIDTGTTLDVVIESDDNSGFTSATTRITFTQVTTSLTSEYATPVGGAITDDWWRAKWTVVGTSYTFAVVMGII